MFLCLLLQPPGVIIQPVVLRGQHLLRVELEYAPFLRLTTVINIKVLGEHFSSLLTHPVYTGWSNFSILCAENSVLYKDVLFKPTDIILSRSPCIYLKKIFCSSVYNILLLRIWNILLRDLNAFLSIFFRNKFEIEFCWGSKPSKPETWTGFIILLSLVLFIIRSSTYSETLNNEYIGRIYQMSS